MIILKDNCDTGAGKRGMECYCLMGTELLLGIYEKVLAVDSGGGCTTLDVYDASHWLTVHLNMAKTASFMCILP